MQPNNSSLYEFLIIPICLKEKVNMRESISVLKVDLQRFKREKEKVNCARETSSQIELIYECELLEQKRQFL